MRRITVFNNISLDGYFTGENDDMSAFHRQHDAEWAEWVSGNASGGAGGTFLFGRKTYEQMRSFWPTPQAAQQMPVVADSMNRTEKLVVSRTLSDPGWANARVIGGDLVDEVTKLKAGAGSDILIMGSGSIVAQLTKARLIDGYTFVIAPFVMGVGRTMFEGVGSLVDLKRTSERAFANGNIVATYELRS